MLKNTFVNSTKSLKNKRAVQNEHVKQTCIKNTLANKASKVVLFLYLTSIQIKYQAIKAPFYHALLQKYTVKPFYYKVIT